MVVMEPRCNMQHLTHLLKNSSAPPIHNKERGRPRMTRHARTLAFSPYGCAPLPASAAFDVPLAAAAAAGG